ncbi:hypothetical protein HDU76_013674 [Blyttiomyces sp. JEL0837]|nr:hypothetical protein HDU76_013674 [Blyttiomyces sp. JEL0837]
MPDKSQLADISPANGYYYQQLERDVFQPTNLSIGPWTQDGQHGGPISALLGGQMIDTVAQKESDPSLFSLVKLSVYLYRPVPTKQPHRLTVHTLRASQSIRHLLTEVTDLYDRNKVYARGEALLSKVQPETDPTDSLSLATKEERGNQIDKVRLPQGQFPSAATLKHVPHPRFFGKDTFMDSVQTVFVAGRTGFFDSSPVISTSPHSLGKFEPVLVYSRPVKGMSLYIDLHGKRKDLTPLDFMVITGDMCSGSSAVLEWGKYAYSNIDYNVFVRRYPMAPKTEDGWWSGFKAWSRVSNGGHGVCNSEFFDEEGVIGNTVQNLVVKRIESK